MRKLTTPVVVLALAATGVAVQSRPAAAVVIDLAAAVTSDPATVSPSGALAFYTATYTNNGLAPVTATLTDATTGGGTFVSHNGGAACTVAGSTNPVVTCTTTLAAGASYTLGVVIRSAVSAAPGLLTNTARASAGPVFDLLDLTPTNNLATVSTPVTPAATSTGSQGFVREGETLQWRRHVLTAVDADLGVVASMSDTVAPQAATCGDDACGTGLHLEYDQDQRFYGTVRVDVAFGPLAPCAGLGAEKCHPLYWRKDASSPTAPLPECGAEGPAEPCLVSVYKIGSNDFHWVVEMQTDDPDLLLPIKSLQRV